MDTIIAERPEISIADEELSSSIPGHAEPQEHLTPEDATPKGRLGKSRNRLMIGASIGVVALAAAGVYSISPYNHLTIANSGRAVAHAQQAALKGLPDLAPAAGLARAPEPSQVAALPSHPSLGGGDELDQFLKLGNHAPAPASSMPAVASKDSAPSLKPPVRPIPQEVGMTDPVPAPVPALQAKAPPTQQAAASLGAPLMAPSPTATVPPVAPPLPQPSPSAAVPASPPDAAQALAQLRPAPLTPQDQVDVLQLVTQLGTLVRDQRLQIEEMRKNQASLQQTVDENIGDFRRRLTLAEARGSIAAAMGAPTQAAVDVSSDGRPGSQPTAPVIQASARSVIRSATADDTTQHRYRIQAASPGLAMLSELDPTGGEERQLTIQPGDNLPGYGRVGSVSQRGTAWVVKADHGLIQ